MNHYKPSIWSFGGSPIYHLWKHPNDKIALSPTNLAPTKLLMEPCSVGRALNHGSLGPVHPGSEPVPGCFWRQLLRPVQDLKIAANFKYVLAVLHGFSRFFHGVSWFFQSWKWNEEWSPVTQGISSHGLAGDERFHHYGSPPCSDLINLALGYIRISWYIPCLINSKSIVVFFGERLWCLNTDPW